MCFGQCPVVSVAMRACTLQNAGRNDMRTTMERRDGSGWSDLGSAMCSVTRMCSAPSLDGQPELQRGRHGSSPPPRQPAGARSRPPAQPVPRRERPCQSFCMAVGGIRSGAPSQLFVYSSGGWSSCWPCMHAASPSCRCYPSRLFSASIKLKLPQETSTKCVVCSAALRAIKVSRAGLQAACAGGLPRTCAGLTDALQIPARPIKSAPRHAPILHAGDESG